MLGTMHQQVLGEPGTEMECDRIWRGGLHLLPPRAAQRPRIAMKSKALFFAVLITVVAHPQILGSAAFATESYPWRKPPSARYGNKQARQPTTYHSTPHGTDQALPGHGEKNGKKKPKSKNSHNDWGIPSSRDLRPLHVPKRGTSIPAALPNGGRVTLVGSGPGDPDLLTVAAHRLLTQNPDALVIADRLVSPEILQLVAGETKIARKLPGCADLAQEEIYWWVYQALAEGRHVIRLKIGDPFVFGRGGEEVLMFRNFGVEAAVIPGVSAAFSAPLLGAIPVTHRGVSNQVVMCTGYGREGSSPDLIRYHKEQTIVFLMAVGRLRELCQRLQEQAGYPSDTPVAIVEKAGCPDQRTVAGNMLTIADIAEQHAIKPPSTIVVGDVVNVLIDKNDEGVPLTGLIQNANTAFA